MFLDRRRARRAGESMETPTTHAHDFSDVDRATDPAQLVRYLDTAIARSSMQFFEQRIVERLGLRSGGKYLDVGCGTGDDVRAMAQQVGTDGWIVGVDSSETMIAEARRRSEGVSLPIEFRLGRAEQLEFADATFDGSRQCCWLQLLQLKCFPVVQAACTRI